MWVIQSLKETHSFKILLLGKNYSFHSPQEERKGFHMNGEAYKNCLSPLWTSVNVFCVVLCSVLASLENVAGIKGKH